MDPVFAAWVVNALIRATFSRTGTASTARASSQASPDSTLINHAAQIGVTPARVELAIALAPRDAVLALSGVDLDELQGSDDLTHGYLVGSDRSDLPVLLHLLQLTDPVLERHRGRPGAAGRDRCDGRRDGACSAFLPQGFRPGVIRR
ncbi:hypothetical protein ACFPRC_35500 [Streptomyces lienomycini]|uniref:Uncharacterized protein n=1 Tax=Streptomyces lienomycini TaxID=284035 RepID=A0ABV9X6T4_9ACTN